MGIYQRFKVAGSRLKDSRDDKQTGCKFISSVVNVTRKIPGYLNLVIKLIAAPSSRYAVEPGSSDFKYFNTAEKIATIEPVGEKTCR